MFGLPNPLSCIFRAKCHPVTRLWHAQRVDESIDSNLFATSALEGNGCLAPRRGRFNPERNPTPTAHGFNGHPGFLRNTFTTSATAFLSCPQQTVLRKTKQKVFCSVAQQPNRGLTLLIAEVPRSHTLGRTPPNAWSARRSGRCIQNKHNSRTPMPSARFEPEITAIKRLPYYGLGRTATWISLIN